MRGMSFMRQLPPPCFRYWEIWSFGDWEKNFKKDSETPSLPISKQRKQSMPGCHLRGRETGSIAIGKVAGMRREIMVRNVYFLLAGLDGTFFVQKSVKIL